LTATDYFTRWVEAIPLRKVNEYAVMDFLQDHIMTRFGVPISLVFDNATYFSSIRLTAFANERGIKLHYSANYYPQGNGLAESTNKNLIRILKKTVIENQRSWHHIRGILGSKMGLLRKIIKKATSHYKYAMSH